MTSQWVLLGQGHTVADFEGPDRTLHYTHLALQPPDRLLVAEKTH